MSGNVLEICFNCNKAPAYRKMIIEFGDGEQVALGCCKSCGEALLNEKNNEQLSLLD